MKDRLYHYDAQEKNPNWFAEPFTVKDAELLKLRRQCEVSLPEVRLTARAFVTLQKVRAEANPNVHTVYTWGYCYYLATFKGFQGYGANPISGAMNSHWSKSNTEYLRLRFLMEADNGSHGKYHTNIVKLGKRLHNAFPDDMMIHGELLNAYKRDYRDDRDKEYLALVRSFTKKYPASYEKARFQIMAYTWLWQATRKPSYADLSIALLENTQSLYPSRIAHPNYYKLTIAEIVKKRNRPKELIVWPPNPPR